MIKRVLRILKEYEVIENNSQRLNKGYKQNLTFTKIWNVLYK